jgi:hypothetical protein
MSFCPHIPRQPESGTSSKLPYADPDLERTAELTSGTYLNAGHVDLTLRIIAKRALASGGLSTK